MEFFKHFYKKHKLLHLFGFPHLVFGLIVLLNNNDNTLAHNPQFESFCGDLALSCIASCPTFRQKCYGSYVAESLKNAGPAATIPDISDGPQIIVPPGNDNIPLSPVSGSNNMLDQTKCKTQGMSCIPVREYEVSECCYRHVCVPFNHVNGKSAQIGACKMLPSAATLGGFTPRKF